MEICFYGYAIQDIGSGSSEYFTLLAIKMAELGHHVTILSSWKRRPDLPDKIKFVSLNKGNSYFQKYVVFPIKSILFFLFNRKFDLIHVASSYSRFVYLLKFISIFLKRPMVYTVFSEAFIPQENTNFAGLIFTSKRLANLCKAQGVYIPIFIDTKGFSPRSKYNFRDNYDFVVGTMGTPMPRRGHVHLIKAIPYVLRKYPRTLFVIASNLPQTKHEGMKQELENQQRFIEGNNLKDNVLYLGEVDVVRFFNSIDLFVYPLQTTVGAIDIPPTILQCLSAGCCLIATDVGGISEVAKDGYNSILIKQSDIVNSEVYAEKIIQLIEDKELFSTLKSNAPESISSYGIDNVVYTVEAYYRKILKNYHQGET